MNLLTIFLIIVIVCTAIFILTYVAHNRDEDTEDGDCDHCNGDCLHCGHMPENKEK
ncbi:MAG: hypothetical protein J6C32_02575 [Eubacterium sp.]|nr:hypothetical protein [Eubacterium sp.]